MKKILAIILFCFLLVNAQEIEVPEFQLSEISFHLKIKNLPDSSEKTIKIIDSKQNVVAQYSFAESDFEKDVTLHTSGNYKISVTGEKEIL